LGRINSHFYATISGNGCTLSLQVPSLLKSQENKYANAFYESVQMFES